jgi:hypothetical protein
MIFLYLKILSLKQAIEVNINDANNHYLPSIIGNERLNDQNSFPNFLTYNKVAALSANTDRSPLTKVI